MVTLARLDNLSAINAVIKELNPPAPHVPSWFTKELTELGGTTDNGKDPQFRLVWGGSETAFWDGRPRIKYPKIHKKMPIGWEVIDEETKLRELLPLQEVQEEDKRVGRIVYDWLDIGEPYFILEEWFAPEIACDGWEKVRYQWNKNNNTWVDKLGPAPVNGLYQRLFTLRTDDGQYIEPGQDALNYIKRILWLQRQEPALFSKRERPPSFVVEQELRKLHAQIEINEAKFEDNLADMMVDRVRRSLLNPTSFPSTQNREIIIAHK